MLCSKSINEFITDSDGVIQSICKAFKRLVVGREKLKIEKAAAANVDKTP